MRKLRTPGKRDAIKGAGIATTATGFCATLAGAKDAASKVTGIDDAYFALAFWPAIACSIAAMVFAAIYLWYLAQERQIIQQLKDKLPDITTCTASDTVELDKLSSQVFGQASSSASDIAALMSIDDEMFWKVVYLTTPNGGQIQGYFVVMRLTQSGIRAIEEGTFSGARPPSDHLDRGKKKKYCNIYIGAVYGANSAVQPLVLAGLIQHIRNLKARNIYARPITDIGLTLMEGYQFRPVDPTRTGLNAFYKRKGVI